MASAEFYGTLTIEERVWGAKRFARLIPQLGQQQGMPAKTPPRRPAQGGHLGALIQQGLGQRGQGDIYHLDAEAMKQILQNDTTQGAASVNVVTPEKKYEATFKVSASEKSNMLVMCGLPVDAGDE